MGSNGIVIIAIGHEFYYKCARNLIATLRAQSDIPITLFCDSLHKASILEENLQTDVVILPETVYRINNRQEAVRAKMFLYEYSPYSKTLYLDADIAWLFKSPNLLFEQLNGVSFTISNGGIIHGCRWGNVEQMKKAFPEGKIYDLFAELIYFEKSKEAKKLFTSAKKVFDNPGQKTFPFAGGRVADEFAFIMAMMQTNIYPHKENFLPIMWPHRDKTLNSLQPYQLNQFGYSIGGNSTPSFAKKKYMIIVQAAFSKLGLQNAFTPRDKRVTLPERLNM